MKTNTLFLFTKPNCNAYAVPPFTPANRFLTSHTKTTELHLQNYIYNEATVMLTTLACHVWVDGNGNT